MEKYKNIKEGLGVILRAFASTAPGGGGIASLSSDYEAHKLKAEVTELQERYSIVTQATDELQTLFLEFLRHPDDLVRRELLIDKLSEAHLPTTKINPAYWWDSTFREICISEIPKQLRNIRIDTEDAAKEAVRGLIKRLKTNLLYEELKPAARTVFESDADDFVKFSSSDSKNLGIFYGDDLNRYLKDQEETLTVAFPPIMLGVSAIFFYLRDIKKYNIKLRFDFANAISLAHRLKAGEFSVDACVIGEAQTYEIISKETKPTYRFAMLMPRGEQRIVTPKSRWSSLQRVSPMKGVFIFMQDEVSTQLFQYTDLKHRDQLDPKNPKPVDNEPGNSIALLESGDPELRLLLFTPHWQAYKKLKLGRVPVVASENEYWYDTPLFLKHSFHEYDKKTASALFVAIRDAWQELKDPVKLEETVDAMFNDPDYSKCLGRYVGLNLLT